MNQITLYSFSCYRYCAPKYFNARYLLKCVMKVVCVLVKIIMFISQKLKIFHKQKIKQHEIMFANALKCGEKSFEVITLPSSRCFKRDQRLICQRSSNDVLSLVVCTGLKEKLNIDNESSGISAAFQKYMFNQMNYTVLV